MWQSSIFHGNVLLHEDDNEDSPDVIFVRYDSN